MVMGPAALIRVAMASVVRAKAVMAARVATDKEARVPVVMDRKTEAVIKTDTVPWIAERLTTAITEAPVHERTSEVTEAVTANMSPIMTEDTSKAVEAIVTEIWTETNINQL
jgi:hypothetical protein